jgi:hypothetical protein
MYKQVAWRGGGVGAGVTISSKHRLQRYINNNELISYNFTQHKKNALLLGHYCSEELANNTANTITSKWSWKDCKLAALPFVLPFFN